MWRSQAEAEGLTLLKADNTTGYCGVTYNPQVGKPKPYQARVRRGGKQVHLGSFATAEEAALCVARTPEGQAAAKRAAPLTSEEARQQARAEGLTLLKADNKTGYFGVYLDKPGRPKPYEAQVSRGGKQVYLGTFATAEEAALCVARTPEGRAAAKKAAAPTTSEEARQQAQAQAEDMVVVEVVVLEAEEVAEEVAEEAEDVQVEVVEAVEVVEVMEHEAVVDEGGRSEGRTKRRRNV